MDSWKEINPIPQNSESASPIAKNSIFDEEWEESDKYLDREFDPQEEGYEQIDIQDLPKELIDKIDAQGRPATRLGRKPEKGEEKDINQLPEINETDVESEKGQLLNKSPEIGLYKKKKKLNSKINSKPTLISYTSTGTRK